jgi:hypothetical protein
MPATGMPAACSKVKLLGLSTTLSSVGEDVLRVHAAPELQRREAMSGRSIAGG